MEIIKNVLYLIFLIVIFVWSIKTCVIYFNGESRKVEVVLVEKLLPRDTSATVIVVDNGKQYRVGCCPINVQVGDRIEVFSCVILGYTMCTNVSFSWILCCMFISFVSLVLSVFVCIELHEIRKKCKDERC